MFYRSLIFFGVGSAAAYIQHLRNENKQMKRILGGVVARSEGNRKVALYLFDILERHDVEVNEFDAMALDLIVEKYLE